MPEYTTKLRIKKSRSVNVKGGAAWVGVEIEREFPTSETPERTGELITEVDELLKEEERKERHIMEDRLTWGY